MNCKTNNTVWLKKTVCEAVSYLHDNGSLGVSGSTNADLNVPVRFFQRFNRHGRIVVIEKLDHVGV